MKAPVALVAALTLAVADPSQGERNPGCSPEPRYLFYSVTGDSFTRIHESLMANGPRDDRGHTRFAYTDWTIEWDWGRSDENRVRADAVQIRCDVTIKLPRLAATPSTSLEVLRGWNDFVERTRAHELHHLEHVVLGAARIRSRLQAAEMRSGSLSVYRANRIIQRVVQEIKHFDYEYDLRTNHGRSEGTWMIAK